MTNIEKLVEFAEREAPEAIPLFLMLIQLCF